MTDYNALYGALTGAVNQTARSMPTLGLPAIMAKPIVEAGVAGLGWGAGATKAASEGHSIDPAPSLYHMANIYGLGGPAAGLTSGGAKAAPFFSAAMRAAESAPLKTGANQQWLGWLKNQPGIKQEELDWMGVPEWLSSQPGPVTKQQITDYIGQNKVDVQEVVKGEKLDEFGHYDASGNPTSPTGTKFSQYQLPGGENYRELLLTLPQKNKNKYGAFVDSMVQKHGDNWFGRMSPEDRATLDSMNVAQDADIPAFKSGHYDEPNVLAHVRFNDRIDANGKKTLFLEEIQSDWHQKGRKQGYTVANKDKMRSELEALQKKQETGESLAPGEPQRMEELDYLLSQDKPSSVPDAPFKSSWPELSLKRMVKWAADNGYDSVSWTPGKVQAARYDLSHQVQSVRATKRQDGSFKLDVVPHGDQGFETLVNSVSAEKLADHVGKELAEKIVSKGGGEFSGLDLQVGGEGMAGFYDKILPNAANKLGKKYGAKVGVTKIGKGGVPGYKTLRNDEIAEVPSEEVWSLPITPELKAKATGEGFSLFTGGKGGTLAGILNQALTGQKPEDNQSSLGDILSRSLTKDR
jgi:hypothetical protein